MMSLMENLRKYVDMVEDERKRVMGRDFVNEGEKRMNMNISDLGNKVWGEGGTIGKRRFSGVGNFIGGVREVII